MDKQQVIDNEKMKLALFKATAVRQVLIELISENRAEIIARAKAKLVAMGVSVEDKEIEVNL